MIDCWHWNFYKDKSIFQELISLLDEDRHLIISTPNKNWFITSDDDITVGATAMMVASKGYVSFINMNYIIYASLIDDTPKNLNTKNSKDNIDNISNLNDSTKEGE